MVLILTVTETSQDECDRATVDCIIDMCQAVTKREKKKKENLS
jgi:hypothetical protein